jgi:hypothetical protein
MYRAGKSTCGGSVASLFAVLRCSEQRRSSCGWSLALIVADLCAIGVPRVVSISVVGATTDPDKWV